MDNFYWMMKIVLIECLSQHHIANVIDLKKSINIQEFHISNKIVIIKNNSVTNLIFLVNFRF